MVKLASRTESILKANSCGVQTLLVYPLTRESKRIHEMLGWASEGWTADMTAELKRNIKLGVHPQTIAGKRAISASARKNEEEQPALKAVRCITFGTLALQYIDWAALHHREGQKTAQILTRHILPFLGECMADHHCWH